MADHKGKLPVKNDAIYSSPDNVKPSSSAIVASERSAAISEVTSTQRPTAKAGSEDKIALDVALSDGDGVSITKDFPLPVYVTESPANEIEDYDNQNATKNGGEVEHDYTTGGEFRSLHVEAGSAGLARFELQVETAPASGVFDTKMVKYNSVSNPTVVFSWKNPAKVASGAIIKLIKRNEDNDDTDLYSIINGLEV